MIAIENNIRSSTEIIFKFLCSFDIYYFFKERL